MSWQKRELDGEDLRRISGIVVWISNSIHSGMVIVADGTPEAAERLQRCLTYDPTMGILRHVDAGYDKAKEMALKHKVNIPMM